LDEAKATRHPARKRTLASQADGVSDPGDTGIGRNEAPARDRGRVRRLQGDDRSNPARTKLATTQPLVIVVDTREQKPYTFWDQVPTVRAALRSGDYSVQGHEDRVAVERKRPVELFSCFAAERARFKREFERLSAYAYAAVVIEGDLADVIAPDRRSTVSPKTVINSLISWSVRYRVNIWFACDREHGEAVTLRILQKFHEAIRLPADARPGLLL
jgi:DNA excision repair protein ERCC-4